MSWIVDRLQNLAGTVDDQAKADLDVDCDQPAMLRDLEQIARVISLRLGQACPSPQACSSQTSDVRYVVPPMFAQYRSVPHGLDPREDASSWADVVTRRDPPAHRTLIPESVYPSARLVISVPTSWPRSDGRNATVEDGLTVRTTGPVRVVRTCCSLCRDPLRGRLLCRAGPRSRGEDRPRGRGVVAEPLQVGLAERAFPRERRFTPGTGCSRRIGLRSRMTASVELQTVHRRQLAAVRREVAVGEVATVWGPAVGKVWDFIRSQPGLWTDGHNIFLYHHPEQAGAPVACEFGVEVTRASSLCSRVPLNQPT